ncbi:homologous recombination OB-fold protein isoform X2 [Ambystoma mexicanum]|uniref:homologous recombination OB-fold protein isoform X2 n=1 Tax=Ambystoma mexicanum TaxID=8296 RepID=UPI0037E7E3B5
MEPERGDPHCQAWSFQNRCAVEDDFEDEDFLSAVEDAETSFPVCTPAKPRCLRPISSNVQSPSRTRSCQEPREGTGSNGRNLSPILSCQTATRLSSGLTVPSKPTSCLRPLSTSLGKLPATSCIDFRSPRELLTSRSGISGALASNRSPLGDGKLQTQRSTSGFGFVKQLLPVEDLIDDGLDDDLFLSACTEVEQPGLDLDPSKRSQISLMAPKRNLLETTEREQDIREEPLCKRSRENGYGAAPEKGLCLQGVETQKSGPTLVNPPTTGSCYINTSMSLRPSSLSEQPSLCPPGKSCSVFTGQNVRLCSNTERPLEAVSGYQVAMSMPLEVEANNSCYPYPASFGSKKSPLPPHLGSRTSGLPVSPAPAGHSSSVSNSAFRQGARHPQAACALLTSFASPVSSLRVPSGQSPNSSTLHPVMTNHLLQLVTAANQTPQAASKCSLRAKSRRFPGPAGVLPQQLIGKNLEEILVSTPHTPTHGAMARMHKQEQSSSQQPVEEEFGKGPWMTMKAELGIDERNPVCFLQTYSVIMVLRKAALKQLPKNKVPNMAVMVKSLMRANVDASAVFRDPTGEMQGTLHHLLLEERENDLKAGSVLLLQQVGVFSPSSRSHYLNVTPNNVVKIYPADKGEGGGQLLEPQQTHNPLPPRPDSSLINSASTGTHEQVFRRSLKEDLNCNTAKEALPGTSGTLCDSSAMTLKINTQATENLLASTDWDTDDDLDSLMGELTEDSLFGGASHR